MSANANSGGETLIQNTLKSKAGARENTRSRTNVQSKISSEHWINLAGKDFRLVGKTIRIGRALDNDIVIDHKSCSRYHAMITLSNERVIFEDLKSRNGIKVNAVPVRRAELKDNDQIRIGDLFGVFFQRSKKGTQAQATTSDGGTKFQFQFEQLDTLLVHFKDRLTTMVQSAQEMDKQKKKKVILAAVVGALLLGFLASMSGGSRQLNVSNPEASLNPYEDVVKQSFSRKDFDRCTEFEDLGNYRQAAACLKALPSTAEKRIALERVQNSQNEFAEKRYNEGVQAMDNFYYDIALLKFQEVAMVADESSEILTKTHAYILQAEQRRKMK